MSISCKKKLNEYIYTYFFIISIIPLNNFFIINIVGIIESENHGLFDLL